MKKALDSVNEKILAAVQRRQQGIVASPDKLPRLVAVSKFKPISSIIEAYQAGQRYFGENYIQELEKKSDDSEILEECLDIKFHFIGHLQSNKVNKLMRVKNLHMVESVDSIKLADLLDEALNSKSMRVQDNLARLQSRLKVLIQVNTSGEEQKNGIQPDQVVSLAEHIASRCRHLEFAGLMTIGRFGVQEEAGPNQDFLRLYELRNAVAKQLSVEPQSLELSMGMSSDFEEAITMGSTNVRVGTLIFGERQPKA